MAEPVVSEAAIATDQLDFILAETVARLRLGCILDVIEEI